VILTESTTVNDGSDMSDGQQTPPIARPVTSRWSGPERTADHTTRAFQRQVVATPPPSAWEPHHLATFAEFHRRGDAVDRWQVESVSDLAVNEHGITTRWVFRRPPATTVFTMDVIVSRGQIARIIPR